MRFWRRVPSLTSIFVLLAGVASGCQDRVWHYGFQVVPPEGGVVDGSLPDASPDHATIDLAGFGGSGGTFGFGGSGGSGGAGGTGGGAVTCDETSPDRETDVLNCGTCFHSCLVPNSEPSCVAKQCKYTCFTDFFDANKLSMDGCECNKSNAGVEACDGLDNNCNGTADEGFDFMNDVANCGGCNVTCSFPFATASCMNGSCRQGACLPGFYDRNPTDPGCETACEKSNGGIEICDGQDNDCNGVVDDNSMAGPLVCRSLGVCAGVQPTCMGQTGWVCRYPTTYQDVEDMTKTCDTLDNDCDGKVDEAFQIGKACTVGSGACANPNGVWVCDNSVVPEGHRCNGSPKPAGTETCNGLDDDCDGKVDELDSASNRTTDDKLIYLSGPGVMMFAYEATRYDSTGGNFGFDSTRRPCSVPGRLPWSNVTNTEAEAACEKIGTGWRLCTAAEWLDACNSSGNTTFPYGATYAAQSCNGWDYLKGGATTLATGALTTCKSSTTVAGDELYDMSGNVKEWVLTTTTTTGPYEMRGGAYNTASFIVGATTSAPGLQCDASVPAPATAVRLPSVGFRCCRTGMLPP